MMKIGLAALSIFAIAVLNGANLSGTSSAQAAKTAQVTQPAQPSAAAQSAPKAKIIEFSADAVQSIPGKEMQTGKLFVSKLGTRFEFQQRGRPIIQVLLPAQGLVRIIFPLERRYIEYKSKPGAAMRLTKSATPCEIAARYQCKMLGETTINGLKAQRWRIASAKPRGVLRIWWDAKRKIALRQEFSDGRIMQATWRGTQKFEDRTVENWEFLYTSPDGRFRRAMSLIAPDLGLAVIEQQPNGAIRRLHNITRGAPDAKLFKIPAGYKRIVMPRPQASRGQRAMSGRRMPSGGHMMSGPHMSGPKAKPARPSGPARPARPVQPTPGDKPK